MSGRKATPQSRPPEGWSAQTSGHEPPWRAMLYRWFDGLALARYSDRQRSEMMGGVERAYLAYASDASVRSGAASGGAVTALLLHALEARRIDGAVVCTTRIEGGKVRAAFQLARTPEGIVAARSSKYVATHFSREALPLLRANPGRFAVCGLPCDLATLRRHERRDPALASRVALRIGLFCGHNSRPALVDGVVARLRPATPGAELRSFVFRQGHWRGAMTATYADGCTVTRPFSDLSNYRNLFLFAERKCMACDDHFAYASDISAGDVWLYALKSHAEKYTGLLCRTAEAAALVEEARRAGLVRAETTPTTLLFAGQGRAAPFHHNVAARARAGRLLGMRIRARRPERVGPIAFLSALWALAAARFTEGRLAPLAFRVPRLVLRGAAVARKALDTFG